MKRIVIDLYESHQHYLAPKTPGVYVWMLYTSINARKAKDPIEMAADLSEFERIARQPSIELRSTGEFFKSKWEGTVNLESRNWEHDEVSSENPDIAVAAAQHFNNIMCTLAPVLYVGKADNLRSRIENHVKALEKIANWEHIDLDSEGKFFAERVHKAEIPLNLLRFSFFAFPSDKGNYQEILEANKKVENFVNRILKPSLGRR